MKEEEIEVLTINKLSGGKDYPQIYEEIKRLRESQVLFKEQRKELGYLKNRIQGLESENEKLKKQLFKFKFKRDTKVLEKREEKRNELRKDEKDEIKSLRRILFVLQDFKKPLCLSLLQKETCRLDNRKLLPCLNFLEENKLIKSERDNKGIQKWFLNEEKRD